MMRRRPPPRGLPEVPALIAKPEQTEHSEAEARNDGDPGGKREHRTTGNRTPAPERRKKRRRAKRPGAQGKNGLVTQAFASPAAGAGASAAGAAASAGALALALPLPLPFAARRPEDFL